MISIHHQIRIDEAHRAFADGVFAALLARIAALHDRAFLRREAAPLLGLRGGGRHAGKRCGRQGGRYKDSASHVVISIPGPVAPLAGNRRPMKRGVKYVALLRWRQ